MTDTIDSTQAEEFNSAEQAAPISLSLTDLVTVAQIIQLSASRGAIRAEEFETVGSVYSKLVAFLDANGAVTRVDSALPTEDQQGTEEVQAEPTTDGDA